MEDDIKMCMDNVLEFGDIALKAAMALQKRSIADLAAEPDSNIRREKAAVLLGTQDDFVDMFVKQALNKAHYKITKVFTDDDV